VLSCSPQPTIHLKVLVFFLAKMKPQVLLTFGAILCHVTAISLHERGGSLQPRGEHSRPFAMTPITKKVLADNTTVGISEALLSNFKLYANFTSASYCPNNENSTSGTPITCPPTVCPLVEADNVTSILSFGSP
jgi:hypothetical protein